MYFSGGAFQITSGVYLVRSSSVGSICPSVGYGVVTFGYAFRKIGHYAVDSANTINPASNNLHMLLELGLIRFWSKEMVKTDHQLLF